MKKILLIEDDKIMRENTAEILELANFNVVTAENGRQGALLAKDILPDLIISDIMMPVLDGYGVLQILSKDPSTSRIPFIFLTAKTEKSEMRKGMELGADDYLTKPFEDTELLSAIDVRLKKSEMINQETTKDLAGLNQFLDKVSGLKELEKLSGQRPVGFYKKKEIIFHAGDDPHYLYFLNKGKIKAYKTNDEGKEYITHMYKGGDYFGHPALLTNKTYSDSAIALEDSEVCKIPKEDFLVLIYNNRDVAAKFMKMLSGNLEDQEKQLLSLAYDTVRKRAAEALLLLQRKYGRPEEKETKILSTREDLASLAGTATETLIRCLSEFKEDGFIRIKGREITILDREGLEEIP